MRGEWRKWVAGLHVQPAHLLPAGAVLGLAMAAFGAVAPRPAPPLKDAVALVNGVPILKADRDRVIEALAASKRNPLNKKDADFALSRLIDEELLIQRSIELGLHRSDPMARKRLVAAMLEWIASDAAGQDPSDNVLRAFYRRNAELFTEAARADVAWFHVARSEPDGKARATKAAERLAAGQPFAKVAAAFASPSALAVPNGMLPPAKLQNYLGPSLTRKALALAPGRPAGPFARTDGWHFLLLRRREDNEPPPFESVRAQVKAEYIRQQGDKAVRTYLSWLRRRADIVYTRGARQ